MLQAALVTGLGLAVSAKPFLPLAYRGVQAVTDQEGTLIGHGHVFAFALLPRVTAEPLIPLPPRKR